MGVAGLTMGPGHDSDTECQSDLKIRDFCWSLSLCAGQDVRIHSLASYTVLARNVQALTEQLCGSY